MRRIALVLAVLLCSTSSSHAIPNALFKDGKLDGWKTEGNAWGVTDGKREGISVKFHAESLIGGEQAVGTLRSEPFTVGGNVISFLANGWDGRYGGKGINGLYLRRASDGEILRTASPPCSDTFNRISWAVGDLKGQQVYFEAVDKDTGGAFAWLGISEIREENLPSTNLRPLKLTGNSTWAVLERDGGGKKVAPYLSSLAGGESGMGAIRSPQFTIDADFIHFDICGHDGQHGGLKQNYACLKDAGTMEELRITYAPGDDELIPSSWDVRDLRGRKVFFEACDGNPGEAFAWMGVDNIDAGNSYKCAFDRTGVAAGWSSPQTSSSIYVSACGVPFTALPSTQSIPYVDGKARIECGFTAKRLYLLGFINSWDHGNPVWAWPEYSQRLFIGDKAGEMNIEYVDGSKDTIPLVFGRMMWWYENYLGMNATEPFSSDPKAHEIMDRALYVYPSGRGGGQAYICVIAPQKKRIAAITVTDNPDKKGSPVVTGVTVDTDDSAPNLEAPAAAPAASNEEARWLEKHLIASDKPFTGSTGQQLDELRDLLYTREQDFNGSFALDIPKGFRGPKITFKGDPYADVLTNIYYHSTQDMDDKVDPDGVFHTSTEDAPSWGAYEGFGTWKLKANSYYYHAWSRDLGRVLQELTELGYESDSFACASWCNRQLMWFPEQFPKVNVNGKPVPGHWVRIINLPEMVQTTGMPEKFGNLENDGHGLIMLFQHKAWMDAGRKPEYITSNWTAIREAAEYICWLFDHPEISRAREDALFSDSEGGGMNHSIYCDFPCWLGLNAYTDMAEAAGKHEETSRWRSYASKLEAGMKNYYPQKNDKFGDIWDPAKAAGWPYGHGVLAPVIIWPDYFGFDLSSMHADWLTRSRNTLKLQLTKCEPDHGSPIAMGYGQCFITQAALLLDEMKDGRKCLERLAQFTYFDGHEPYIVPEGCEINESHTWWHRTGDLGNAVQEGEAVKCVRIVLGIDDGNPNRTLFIPRMPTRWTEISCKKYPVLTVENGRVVKRKVDMEMSHTKDGYDFRITSDGPLSETAIRIGPYPLQRKSITISVNGKLQTLETFQSGDSAWAWVTGLKGVKTVTVSESN